MRHIEKLRVAHTNAPVWDEVNAQVSGSPWIYGWDRLWLNAVDDLKWNAYSEIKVRVR